MSRYLKVFWVIIRNTFVRDSKVSGFVMVNMINQLLYIGLSLVFFAIVFGFTDNFAGWNYYQVLFLFGFARFISEFNKTFYRQGVNSLSNELVREGRLDLYLTKPLDTMIFVSMTKPKIYGLLGWFFSIGIMIYAARAGHIPIELANFLWFLLLAVFGSILYYFLTILVIIPAFWLQRLWVLSSLIGKFTEIMRYPVGIFNSVTKLFLGLIFPIMIVTYIPVRTLFYAPNLLYIMYLVLVTIIFGFITKIFWEIGVRSYGSASS